MGEIPAGDMRPVTIRPGKRFAIISPGRAQEIIIELAVRRNDYGPVTPGPNYVV